MNKRHIEKRISLIPESVLGDNILNDQEYLFLLKKTEKIIMATYILTDFIPSGETIKKTLKDNSHEALNSVCDFLYSRSARGESVQRIKSSYIKLLTQYNLAHITGYISQMNYQVIKDELNNILRIIDTFERELTDEQVPDFKQNYFNVDVRNKRQYKKEKQDVSYKRQEPQTNVFKDKSPSKNSLLIKEDVGDREGRVIEVIKDKGLVSIKDISDVILDCSEKTIQRTLNKLISDGKVLKKGERRWAKYELAKQ